MTQDEPPKNQCQRDTVTPFTPREKPADPAPAEVPHTGEFHPVEEAPPPTERWLGPVADTVLADFVFYGLFAGVPLLFLWFLKGHWWLFRNAEWIAIGLFFWFVGVVAWRRYRGSE